MTTNPLAALDLAEGDTPMHPAYLYDAAGQGVRRDIVDAVLNGWAGLDLHRNPATPLRYVGQGAINSVENIGRVSARSALEAAGETLMSPAVANLLLRCVIALVEEGIGPEGNRDWRDSEDGPLLAVAARIAGDRYPEYAEDFRRLAAAPDESQR